MLWRYLCNRQLGGVRFNRQAKVGPFICDFAARGIKLIIEVDGGQHAIQAEQDESRTNFLKRRGYRVLRFWNNDVLENMDGVLATIERVLRDMPSPGPSRKAGGEEK